MSRRVTMERHGHVLAIGTALLTLAGAVGCVREEAIETSPPPVDSSAQNRLPESHSVGERALVGEGYPMPGPYRRRLGAAVALNATCEVCHKDEADEWRRSRHRESNTNAAYRTAFATEPSPFCRGCHAPEADPAQIPSRAVSELGVGCVTCHVTEEGFVLAAASPSSSAGSGPHPLRRSAEFAHTGGCVGCHEFRFPGAAGDDDGHYMQTTAREHASSPAAEKSCANCHMPMIAGRRSHDFAAVRDPTFLRQNLNVTASIADNKLRVTLLQPDPGHAFPTGDLFRRLEVGFEIRGPGGTIVKREARHLARHFELVPGRSGRLLVRDDRVFSKPNVVEMALPPAPSSPAMVAWWVTFHRVATVGTGADPEAAKIESSVPLYSGILPWGPTTEASANNE